MPYASTADARLYFEAVGEGPAVVFVHEFAADWRSWQRQVEALSTDYRCLAFNARGYPPSSIPLDGKAYSQSIAADDIAAVMDADGVQQAHLIGLSMGAAAALEFGLGHSERVLSLVLAGIGSGAMPDQHERFALNALGSAAKIRALGMAAVVDSLKDQNSRATLRTRRADIWDTFIERLEQHHPLGMALTLEGVQARRPCLTSREADLALLRLPVLLVAGECDDSVHPAAAFLQRVLPDCRSWYVPDVGHAVPTEVPEAFNREVRRFLVNASSRGHGECITRL